MREERHIQTPPLQAGENYVSLLRRLTSPFVDSSSSKELKLQALKDLRDLHNSQYELFSRVFGNVVSKIAQLMDDESNSKELIDEGLLLINEVLTKYPVYCIDLQEVWLKIFIPRLLNLALFHQYCIRSTNVLTHLVDNMICSETVESFMDVIIESKNDEVREFAGACLIKSIENFDLMQLENLIDWEVCLVKLARISQLNDGKFKDISLNCVAYISRTLEMTNYTNLIKRLISDKEAIECLIQLCHHAITQPDCI